jgi:hypothetical protein
LNIPMPGRPAHSGRPRLPAAQNPRTRRVEHCSRRASSGDQSLNRQVTEM